MKLKTFDEEFKGLVDVGFGINIKKKCRCTLKKKRVLTWQIGDLSSHIRNCSKNSGHETTGVVTLG